MKLFIPLFSFTLFLSAFLLFSVQPMFSKMVLPYLGGTPMVWNTAMVFFQAMLLAGYGYAFFIAKIPKIRFQILIHLVLFGIFLAFLPFSIYGEDVPEDMPYPTLWQIGLMLTTIGPPFFILAGCAPLVQRWFSLTHHRDAGDPYFLYAASNVGSMLALLSYPVLIEPLFGVFEQAYIWSLLYTALIIFIGLCGILTLIYPHEQLTEEEKVLRKSHEPEIPISLKLRLFWLLLSFVPSSLMLGVTTYITTDIASVPLLWVVPLAIYVGTFIIAFAKHRPVSTETVSKLHVASFFALIFFSLLFSNAHHSTTGFLLHLITFSIIVLSCHMRLVDHKPNSRHLTEFYFFMSLGGVMGGLFNALLAPVIFVNTWEYTLILSLSAFLIAPSQLVNELKSRTFFKAKKINNHLIMIMGILFLIFVPSMRMISMGGVDYFIFGGFCILFLVFIRNYRTLFAVCVTYILLVHPFHFNYYFRDVIYTDRNFFGIIKVAEHDNTRILYHGTTLHGMQSLDEKHQLKPLSYYHKETSIGEAFEYFSQKNIKKDVAVLGLGAGSVACHTAPGRHFTFYEIDPQMVALSETYEFFTYLKDCGNSYDIIIGDARLRLDDAQDEAYDLMLVDVFSSDNIPVHMMTEEAIELFLSKLSADGALLMHITNRHISLEPVLATIAKEIDIPILFRRSIQRQRAEGLVHPTHTAILARNPEIIEDFKEMNWIEVDVIGPQYHWKDNYVNILTSLNIVRDAYGKTLPFSKNQAEADAQE